MNFLSHYYFDLHSSPHEIMGCVLPDLIKNAVKTGNLNPQKREQDFQRDPQHQLLLKGWKRHLEVDKYFHASVFFTTETAKLKTLILPVTAGSEIRPSFLAHIALELLLDHLLLKKNKLNATHFYNALELVDKEVLNQFLILAGMEDPEPVLSFINRFTSSKYLLSYQKNENIGYALNRICMRLWPEPMPQNKIDELNAILMVYNDDLETHFSSVFDDIELMLR